jgi:sugar lactone lactonase YvrE
MMIQRAAAKLVAGWGCALALALAACGGGGEPAAASPPPCAPTAGLPLAATLIPGTPPAEDLTFDADGYLLALENGRSLVRVARGAPATLVAPNVVANGRGLRALTTGDVVIADQDRSLLLRLDRAGGTRRLTTALGNPNGLALGPGGQLYVTDFRTTGDVYRVDPDSGAATLLGRPASGSNGVVFTPDYRTLIVGDHDTGDLYRLPIDPTGGPTGEPRPPERWASGLVRPDGLAADRCGNVYAASWDRKVYRVSPTGEVAVLAELPTVVSAVAFGSGKQGWRAESLYAMAIQQGGVYEIDVGQTAPPPPPP